MSELLVTCSNGASSSKELGHGFGLINNAFDLVEYLFGGRGQFGRLSSPNVCLQKLHLIVQSW